MLNVEQLLNWRIAREESIARNASVKKKLRFRAISVSALAKFVLALRATTKCHKHHVAGLNGLLYLNIQS